MMLTRFVEALNAGDTSVRFAAGGGAGFDALGAAFDSAIARARAEHDTATEQVRFQQARSEEHTSELQSLMRISYAVFRLKKTNHRHNRHIQHIQQSTLRER